jgi:hypothetical protein
VFEEADFMCVGNDLSCGLGSEYGVAPLALAAFDGFEEERRGFAGVGGDEAAVGENGRELVVEEADAEGDDEGLRGCGVGGSRGVDDREELLLVWKDHGKNAV